MNRWTLVPMRGLALGKSRLAGVLDPRERLALNTMLLKRVLDAVAQADGTLTRCIVASACDDALGIARARGAATLREAPGTGLNAALEFARALAVARGASALLTLAADLPDVTGQALRRLSSGVPGGAAVIADKHGRGTNGLLLPAGAGLRFAFGENSLARHVAGLRAEGVEPVIWHDPALAFDLDSPDDHETWRQRAPQAIAG